MKIKLAEALLRRKELQEKVDQLRQINVKELYEVKVKRQQITDSVDNIVAEVPKLNINQVTSAFDWLARRLRMIDALIQQSNWTVEIDIDKTVMDDYKEQNEG